MTAAARELRNGTLVLVRTTRVGCIKAAELERYLHDIKTRMREEAHAALSLAVEFLPEWADHLTADRVVIARPSRFY